MKDKVSSFINQVINGTAVNIKGKKARWTKVKHLKPGAKICVTGDGTSPSEVMFDEILEIKHLGREQVYDIEVEGTHNFVGNDIIAHNTYQLKIDETGKLEVPELIGGKIVISAPLNNFSLQLSSNSLSGLANFADSTGMIDLAAILSAEQDMILGLQTEVASNSAVIASVSSSLRDHEVAWQSSIDSLKAEIASLSAIILNTAGKTPDVSPSTSGVEASNSAVILSGSEGSLADASASNELRDSSPSASASAQNDNGSLQLTPPETLLSTGSATLVDLSVTSSATISGQLVSYDLSVQNIFKSLGDSFLGNTVVAGNFSVDGTLSMTGDSLNSIACPVIPADAGIYTNGSPIGSGMTNCGILYIQSSPLASGVDFFNGQVVIDKTGKLVAQEIVAKTITTEKLIIGSSRPGSNNTSTSLSTGSYSSTESSSGEASLGEATIPAGQTEIPIFTTAVTDKSKIFLTPTTSTGGQALIQGEIVPGSGFVVKLDHTFNTDIKFNWVIFDQQ